MKTLVGYRFGLLSVICFSHSKSGAHWYCRCECGGESIVRGAVLRYGSTMSCGCGSRAQARKNMREIGFKGRGPYWPHTRKLKELHRNILHRCYDPRNKRFDSYGGRGIRVCDEWRENRGTFFEWVMLNGWGPGRSIDRIDNNGDYEPSNCRFVGAQEQANNTTRNRFIEFNGKRRTISEWARELGVSSFALNHRFFRGWTAERALTQPFR